MVPAAPPFGDECPEHLIHHGRGREDGTAIPGRSERYAEVLAVVLGLAARGEVVRQELPALDLQDLAGRQASREGLDGTPDGLKGEIRSAGPGRATRCGGRAALKIQHSRAAVAPLQVPTRGEG